MMTPGHSVHSSTPALWPVEQPTRIHAERMPESSRQQQRKPMTTRAELQGKSLEDLRIIASSVGVETDGLQKAKLIAAILGSEKFELSEEPAPVELPTAEKKSESNGDRSDNRSDSRSHSNQGGSNQGGGRKRSRKRGGRDHEPIDESELEVREGFESVDPMPYLN